MSDFVIVKTPGDFEVINLRSGWDARDIENAIAEKTVEIALKPENPDREFAYQIK